MTSKSRTTQPTDDGKKKVFDDFKAFCRVRSKIQPRDITLDNNVAVINRIIRFHRLPLHGFTAEDLQNSVTSLNTSGIASPRPVAPATINTNIAVLRRWSEFQGLDPESRELRRILRFNRFLTIYGLRVIHRESKNVLFEQDPRLFQPYYGRLWHAQQS